MTDAPDPTHDDGGAVGRFLSRVFGRSYRTTLAGYGTILLVGAANAPGVDPTVAHWVQVGATLLGGAGLIIAKDSRVSGTPR